MNTLRPGFLLLLILLAAASSCAETRWCDVTGRGAADTVVYPPIAKAARVSGLVMGYLRFTTDGKVTGFDPIRGPAMLRESMTRQFLGWKLQTPATGTELCQTLVVADFGFCPYGEPCMDNPNCSVETAIKMELSILRFQARSRVVWICDPAGTIGYGNPFRHAWNSTKRAFRNLSQKH